MWRSLSFLFVWSLLFLAFPASVNAYYTNMPASLVIGQPDLTSNSSAVTQSGLTFPEDMIIANGKLIVSERNGNRIVIWNKIPTQNGTPADVVLGQPDFVSNTADNGGISCATLDSAMGLTSDGQRLIVADRQNRRVLIWNQIPTTNFKAADVVVGQTGCTGQSLNQGGSAAANTLGRLEGVFTDGTRLFVADGNNNNRVLIYNSIPTSNNASADLVLGQPNFSETTVNNGGVSASTMNSPTGVFFDGQRLLVADQTNNRALIWNSLPSANGQPADVVVGQPDFATVTDETGGVARANNLQGLAHPRIFNGRLFLDDVSNSRVLIFNQVPTTNGASADIVLGQPNFSSDSVNQGGSVAANTMNFPQGMFQYNNQLFVAENNNHRILVFNNVLSGPQLSINTPEQSMDSRLKVSGSVQLGERGKYALQKMQANVNGQGFSNVSYLSGGRDNGTENTLYDFSHEFEPWAGISAKDQYDLSKGYTLQLKASSFNAEEDNLFYFQPFELKFVLGSILSIKLNKDYWDRIKNNLDSYEIQTKRNNIWTTLIENIPLNSESITSTKSLSGEIRLIAKDKWGHRQETNSIKLPAGISSYNPNFKVTTAGFPLQINKITGVNLGTLSTYMSIPKNSFSTASIRPTFSGIAYAGSQVTLLITDPVIGRSQTFKTTTNSDSSWQIKLTLYNSSIVDAWVTDTSGRYTELPAFKLTVFQSQQ